VGRHQLVAVRQQLKADVDYQAVARQVFLATDAARLMSEAGLTPPTSTSKGFTVMGKAFDPTKPEDYIKTFVVRRS
jgi:nitrate/nitrite transport system substrate-binding protein